MGKVTVEGKPGADPDILRTMGKVDLEILPNGRFNIFVDGLSRQGTLEYAANSATLHYEQVMGRPSKDAGSATVQQVDSENLKFEDESKSLVLKRMQPPGGSGRIP